MNYRLNKTRRSILYNEEREFILPIGLAHYINKPEYKDSEVFFEKDTYYFGNKNSSFILYPPFSKEIEINGNSYNFFIVTKDQDKIECQSLILKEHYLPPPNKGLYIACRENSEIIACCVIDELSHGNPTGRTYVSPALTKKHNWPDKQWSKNSSNVKRELKICWLSRIVVSKKYHGQRIATHLLQLLPEVLSDYHPMNPHYLEVIATYEKEGKKSFNNEQNMFLNSNYNCTFLSNYTHRIINPETGNYVPTPGRRYYFWVEIPYKRLFVPLSKEPFYWFMSGKKKWELRKNERQYTNKHVYKGRSVEFRMGYSSDEKYMANIKEVLECNSLEEVFDKVNFKRIIPTAKNKNDAILTAKKILNPSEENNFIVFRVEQDTWSNK